MKYEHVTLTFKVYWQFKDYPHLKVTKCKKIIDTKRGVLLKYGSRGFYIDGKYYKRDKINSMLEKIKPFDNMFRNYNETDYPLHLKWVD